MRPALSREPGVTVIVNMSGDLPIESIARLRLRPEDTLVIHYKGRVTAGALDEMKATAERVTGHSKILMAAGPVTFSVIEVK